MTADPHADTRQHAMDRKQRCKALANGRTCALTDAL